MRRPLIALSVLAAALAAAPAAGAKGEPLRSLAVCGPDACAKVSDRGDVRAISHSIGTFAESGREAAAPPLGGYYRLQTSPEFESLFFVPGGPVLAAGEGWVHLDGAVRAALGRATAGLAPYRPRLSTVWVGATRARDVGPYTHLFDRRPTLAHVPYALYKRQAVVISVLFADPRPGVGTPPWNGRYGFSYEPRSGLLRRPDGQWVRPSAALAGHLAADTRRSLAAVRTSASTAPTENESGGGGSGPLVMASAALLAIAVGGFGLVRRRRARNNGGPA